MSGLHAVLLGLLALSAAAGPVAPPDERPAEEWTKTFVLQAEESEPKEPVVSRRIEVEPPVPEVWIVEEVSKVETWDWACNCYRRIPSAEVVSARMERGEDQKVSAVIISVRPATVCSPTGHSCWKAPWEVTVTLRGKTKPAVGVP